MVVQNFPDNILYELDNLDVLRGMNSATVDLIATDPPFNTGRNRSGSAGFYEDNWKWGDESVRPDQWAWNAVHPVWLEQIQDDNPALASVIESARAAHDDGIAAFLCFLSVRLMECRRVLKPTGSIYLHCDPAANGYIRMAMDAIFGHKNFRNELIWHYGLGGFNVKHWFPRKHDTIFYYAKSDKAHHNKIRGEVSKWMEAKYSQEDETGKFFVQDGVKYYLKGGKPVDTVWDNDELIDYTMSQTDSERTGSPDQKPLAVYERFILASSKPGDLVLDPFAGCATTIIAARKHGRRWVGVDRRTDARYHVVCRLAGIKAKDAEETIRKRPDLANWLDEQLAKYDAHYSADAPQRTDAGENAAPQLGPVYTTTLQPWQRLRRGEMSGILRQAQAGATGALVVCAGCGREMEEPFMELDHVTPKSGYGENYITNRILVCGPCNGRKKQDMTFPKLHRENKRVGWMRDEPKAKAAMADARRVTARVRDAWASPDVQALLAAARGEG